MCGRYVAANDPNALAAEFSISELPTQKLAADFNVAPTKRVYIVVDQQVDGETTNSRRLEIARWGLIPSWAKDPTIASRLINARAEAVGEKPSFRSAFTKRRCLVPADGYYEWVDKKPYYLRSPDDAMLAMAGLYEWWRDPGAAVAAGDAQDRGPAHRLTCTVITTAATPEVAHIHQRMPLLVDRSEWAAWLDPGEPDASQLVMGPGSTRLVASRVGSDVNNVRNNGPGLIRQGEF